MVAIEVVIPFQRFDQQEVHRKPNGTAPIGVAAEHAAVRLARNIFHAMIHSSRGKDERLFLMDARQGANAARREEFSFVQEVAEHALESSAGGNGQPAL